MTMENTGEVATQAREFLDQCCWPGICVKRQREDGLPQTTWLGPLPLPEAGPATQAASSLR